jgi:hypothetical protein
MELHISDVGRESWRKYIMGDKSGHIRKGAWPEVEDFLSSMKAGPDGPLWISPFIEVTTFDTAENGRVAWVLDRGCPYEIEISSNTYGPPCPVPNIFSVSSRYCSGYILLGWDR